jgi:hypothetical protein
VLVLERRNRRVKPARICSRRACSSAETASGVVGWNMLGSSDAGRVVLTSSNLAL